MSVHLANKELKFCGIFYQRSECSIYQPSDRDQSVVTVLHFPTLQQHIPHYIKGAGLVDTNASVTGCSYWAIFVFGSYLYGWAHYT